MIGIYKFAFNFQQLTSWKIENENRFDSLPADPVQGISRTAFRNVARDEASGHLLIDECLALLFVVYIEPSFGAYMLERLSEMLIDGFSVSDTWLAKAAGLRFTREELTQILENYET